MAVKLNSFYRREIPDCSLLLKCSCFKMERESYFFFNGNNYIHKVVYRIYFKLKNDKIK